MDDDDLVSILALPVEDALTVVTCNMRYGTADDGVDSWRFRRDLLCDTLRDLAPDILGLQEALSEPLEYIGAAFPGYGRVGVGRNDGVHEGEWAAILFRESRLEAIASGTFWLSETPGVPGSRSWDAPHHPRICTWAELRDRRTDRTLLVLNTHWDNEGRHARLHSAGMIAAFLARHSPSMHAVLMGDFNDTPDSPALRFLLGEADLPEVAVPTGEAYPPSPRLRDSFTVGEIGQEESGTFHGFGGTRNGDRIDYLLTTEGIAVESYQIVHASAGGRFPSDHFPVTVRLRVT